MSFTWSCFSKASWYHCIHVISVTYVTKFNHNGSNPSKWSISKMSSKFICVVSCMEFIFIGLWNSSMFTFPLYDDIILSCSISSNKIHSKNSFTIIHLWKFHLHHQLYAIYQFINNWVLKLFILPSPTHSESICALMAENSSLACCNGLFLIIQK